MILGFSAFAGGGKDTAGRFLEEHYGFRRAHYATKLKRLVGDLYNFSHHQLYGAAKDVPDARYAMPGECPSCGAACRVVDRTGRRTCDACRCSYPSHLTPRLALQVVGVVGRRLYGDVWVEATMQELPVGRVAICDVRFPNEVRAIQARGGRVVRLTRGAPESAHPSETALADRPELFDHVIDNRGPVEELHAALADLMSTLRIPRTV